MEKKYLNYTDVEVWSVEDILQSLTSNPPKKKRIIIPKFQRTIVWKNEQRRELIDSIKRGLPIGAMLLYKVGESNEITEYLLIDGLQRVTTLKKYYEKPTQFYDESNLDDTLVKSIVKFINSSLNIPIQEETIRKYIVEWIHGISGFEETEGFSSAELAIYLDRKLSEEYGKEFQKHDIFKLTEILKPYLKKIKEESDIREFKIPMIVYTGDKKYLPLIFERINSKGTQLNKYQVFAATWTSYEPIEIKNKDIVNAIKAKYESLIEEGFEIENYDPETFDKSKFTYFEYLFGFGKLLSKEYPLLFRTSKAKHEADSAGFNIVAICVGHDLRKLHTLPESLKEIRDLQDFENKVLEAVKFVNDTLSSYIGIKANTRKSNIPVVHTEFQVVAMVGKAFKSKYQIKNGKVIEVKNWRESWKKLKKYLPQHYLYEILKGYWSGTGDKKAMERANSDWYEKPVPRSAWEAVLEEWHKTEKSKREKGRKRVSNVTVLFLKYLYASILTVKDEKSNKFDLDHVIPFNILKPAAEILNGIPISAIGNLSILPEDINRGIKRGNLLYSAKMQKLLILNQEILKEISTIYDLSNKIKAAKKKNKKELQFKYAQQLAEHYERYLDLRFNEMKKILFKTLNIK